MIRFAIDAGCLEGARLSTGQTSSVSAPDPFVEYIFVAARDSICTDLWIEINGAVSPESGSKLLPL